MGVIDLRYNPDFFVSKDIWTSNISTKAKITYATLCYFIVEKKNPSINEIASICGFNPRTIYRAITELKEKGIIERKNGHIDLLI